MKAKRKNTVPYNFKITKNTSVKLNLGPGETSANDAKKFFSAKNFYEFVRNATKTKKQKGSEKRSETDKNEKKQTVKLFNFF